MNPRHPHAHQRLSWRWFLPLLAVLFLIAPFPAPADAACSYTVQRGDTLAVIASRHATSVRAILQSNPAIGNPNRIRVGQALTLPGCAVEAGLVPAPEAATPPLPLLAVPAPVALPLQAAPAPPAELQSPLWQRAHDATIRIRHPIAAPSNGGSGIVIGTDGRTFLTAYHVIGNPMTGEETRRVAIGPFGDWTYTAEVIATDPSLDLAVLRVREKEFPGFAVAPLGRSGSLRPGSPIYTLSYPGFEGGLVAGRGRLLMELSTFHNRSPLIVTDAAASFGSSGGVAVDERGEVIGIITGGIIGRGAMEQLGYSGLAQSTLLVPIDAASDLLRRAGIR